MFDPITDDQPDSDYSALCSTVKILRDEAVKGRADSGIEAEWLEDEEYYEGIDDANRAERFVKPTSPDGRVRIERSRTKKASRSTVFVNITRPYVNAASAQLADKLFPSDDSNYGMRPTPMPDLVNREDDQTPVMNQAGQPMTMPVMDEQGQPAMAPQMMGGQPMMGANRQPAMAPVTKQVTVADLVKQEMTAAKKACELANKQIDDWLVQCNYHNEGRRVIEDAARLGAGVLKGPFPESVRRRAIVKSLEGIGMTIQDELIPNSKCISIWNIYPDPACGESIHRGRYIFERDEINSRQLQELKRDPSYLAREIDRIIEEGPKNRLGESKRPQGSKPNNKEFYEIWYYHGYLTERDLIAGGFSFDEESPEQIAGLLEVAGDESMGEPIEEGFPVEEGLPVEEEYPEQACEDDDKQQYPALVVMVNDTIIKATLQPLDSGEFPYDVFVWQRRSGHWAGIGVARQMRTSQDGVNAGTRNMMDNAGVSGSPILIIDRSKIEPADGKWNIGSQKIYYTLENEVVGNIRDAFTWIIAPSMQQELANVIQFWLQRAEDETGLPMLLQGQQGKAPETVGGMTLLNNNASSVLRRIARNFDAVTEAHIGRYYEWLLMYGENDEMKGDFTIDARGSSALIERDGNSQLLGQILAMAGNPIFGQDPELVMAEFLKSQRFDPEKTKISDEKRQQIAQAQQQQQPDPRIAVAQMNAQVRQGVEQAETERMGMRIQAENQQFAAELEAKRQSDQVEAALRQWEKQIEAQIETAKISADQGMNVDTLKASLAKETMKLRTTMQLAMQRAPARLMPQPPAEPLGRAKPGESYQS